MDSTTSSNIYDTTYESTKNENIDENFSKNQSKITLNLKGSFLVFYEIFKCILIITNSIFLYFIFIKQKKSSKQTMEHILKNEQKTETLINKTIKDEVIEINKNILKIIKQFENMGKNDTINKTIKFHKKNNSNKINNIITKNNRNLEKYLNMTNFSISEDELIDCKLYDGFNKFKLLKESKSYILCNGENNKHICHYQQKFGFEKGGALCELENVILNPYNFKYYYKCPNGDFLPELSDYFFNMKCNEKCKQFSFHPDYGFYFNHWFYDYYINNEKIEEIGKNKTVLIISARSSNIYHGFVVFMNALSTMYIYGLEPENVQLLFIEKCSPEFDLFYPLYSKLISRGGDIIFFNELAKNKKYLIKHSINVPQLDDSPFWIYNSLLYCKYRTPPFKYLLHLIAKYLFIPEFQESLDYNKTVIRYSTNIKNVDDPIYTKFVTIQWRKPFPPGRKNQARLMGNGPDLLDKLQDSMKDNVLVRLVDTAYLSLEDQISLMLKTDYFIGIHGAGIILSSFLPDEAIVHEISVDDYYNSMPLAFSRISGHKSFKDLITGYTSNKNGEYMYMDSDHFVKTVLSTMEKNNF